MTKRDNHYEAAFEEYLRAWGIPYVAVDETRRCTPEIGESVKNADFIVSPGGATRFIVDVKGRLFPAGVKQPRYWKNWSTHDDLVGLSRWENFLGGDYEGLLVFAFLLVGDRAPLPPEQLFEFRGSLYAFLGVRLSDYIAGAKTLSPRWQTVGMPTALFRESAIPVDELFGVTRDPLPCAAE